MQLIEGYENTRVERVNDAVYFLTDGSRRYVLPRKESPRDLKEGDSLRVFLFHDKEGAVVPTLREPLAVVGDFAALRVRGVIPAGMFLDRGLNYDLFVPQGLYKGSFQEGDIAVVRLIPDKAGHGVVATTHFASYFERNPDSLEEGQQVELLVFSQTNLGYGVVIDNGWEGLLYGNQVFEDLKRGDKRTGYISRIREDRRIDVSLQPPDFKEAAREARVLLQEAVERAGGFLPLGDSSSPEEIKRVLPLSKKRFKAAAGMLMKEGWLEITPSGLRRKVSAPDKGDA